MQKVYFDTCIISGIAKVDLKTTDQEALRHIGALFVNEKIQLCGSTVARDEIDEIPTPYREPHEEIYNILHVVKGSTFEWIDEDMPSWASQRADVDPVYVSLRDMLPDENDARHIYLAKKHGATSFVTADEKTILKYAGWLKTDIGIAATSPSGFINSTHDQ
jgi:hypothetical protein